MTTQSIIIYRNPMEAALWESGLVFPIFVGCAAGFISFLVLYKLAEMVVINRRKTHGWRYKIPNFVVGAISVSSLVIGVSIMMILT